MNRTIKMLNFRRIVSLLSLMIIAVVINPTVSYAQEPKNEHYEKAKKKRKADAEEAEKEIMDRHEKIQSKNTRKMMRRTKRKSKRIKAGKQPEPWFRRMFRK